MDISQNLSLWEIEKDLQDVEVRLQAIKEENARANLTEIMTPEDVRMIAESKRNAATARNNEFLKNLEIELGKLFTKNLCPLDSKLQAMKEQFFKEIDKQTE